MLEPAQRKTLRSCQLKNLGLLPVYAIKTIKIALNGCVIIRAHILL